MAAGAPKSRELPHADGSAGRQHWHRAVPSSPLWPPLSRRFVPFPSAFPPPCTPRHLHPHAHLLVHPKHLTDAPVHSMPPLTRLTHPPPASHTSLSALRTSPLCTAHPSTRPVPPHAFRLPPSALPTSPLPPTTPCALCGSHVPTSGQHRCQHHAARPHVHRLGPELGATQQLGGHVGQGAAHLVQQPLAAVMLEDGGQAKIGDFQVVWAKRKNWLKADNRGAPGCPWHAPRSSRSRFSGFRSRWVMPMLCR